MWFLLWLTLYLEMCYFVFTFLDFQDFPPLLTLDIIPFWLENILCMIWIIFNLMKLVLWSNIWSVLVNVTRILEKNVYSVVLGWDLLSVSFRFSWLIILLKSFISLLIICLINCYRKWDLKSPAIILSYFSLHSVSFTSCILGALFYIYIKYIYKLSYLSEREKWYLLKWPALLQLKVFLLGVSSICY